MPNDIHTVLLDPAFCETVRKSIKQTTNKRWLLEPRVVQRDSFQQTCLELLESDTFAALDSEERIAFAKKLAVRVARKAMRKREARLPEDGRPEVSIALSCGATRPASDED